MGHVVASERRPDAGAPRRGQSAADRDADGPLGVTVEGGRHPRAHGTTVARPVGGVLSRPRGASLLRGLHDRTAPGRVNVSDALPIFGFEVVQTFRSASQDQRRAGLKACTTYDPTRDRSIP